MNEQDLFRLKEDVEEAKQKVSELKGERQALMKQLKEEWDCDTVEQAEEKIKEMESEIGTFSEDIETGMKQLKDKLEK